MCDQNSYTPPTPCHYKLIQERDIAWTLHNADVHSKSSCGQTRCQDPQGTRNNMEKFPSLSKDVSESAPLVISI